MNQDIKNLINNLNKQKAYKEYKDTLKNLKIILSIGEVDGKFSIILTFKNDTTSKIYPSTIIYLEKNDLINLLNKEHLIDVEKFVGFIKSKMI